MKRKDESEVHPTMRLLYQVARTQAGIESPTELASFFNASHGAVNKWEERGVPAQVAIDAQVLLGIDANLLSPNPNLPKNPTVKVLKSNPFSDPLVREVIDLLNGLEPKQRLVVVEHMKSLIKVMSPHPSGTSVPMAA